MLPAKPFHGTVRFTGHKGAVYALCASFQPRCFLSAGGDGSVVQWNLDTPDSGTVIAKVARAIFSIHHPAPERLYLGDEDGGLHVVDLDKREEVQIERAHVKGIFAMATLPDGRLVLAAGDGSISTWVTGQLGKAVALQRKIPLSDDKVRGLALDPSGKLLAVACGDGSIHILDAASLDELHTLNGHDIGANSLAWHPSKPVLVSGGKDGHLRFWRSDTAFALLHAFPAHRDTIYHIAFSPDGSKLASAARDKSAKLWNADNFDILQKLDRHRGGHGYSVNTLLWIGNDMLITGGDDKAVVAWEQA